MSISRQASSEPEPPKVVSVKSRTSSPRATVTWRSALAWFHAEISRIPVAVLSRVRSELAAQGLEPAAGGVRAERDLPAQQVRGDPAEDDVRVGHRGLGAPAGVAHRAGVGAGARGPTLSVPSGDSQAIEPPPAPTVTTSIIGIFDG